MELEREALNRVRPRDDSSIVRELLAIGFRQRRLVKVSFLAVFLTTLVVVFLQPREYESEMKILVRRERVDDVVSPDQNATVQIRDDVTDEELQSESELLKSRDLLEKVVVDCGMDRTDRGDHSFTSFLRGVRFRLTGQKSTQTDAEKIAGLVQNLQDRLTVEPILKTNLISATYRSKDPNLAANVLQTLASLYLEKHLAIHRPPGTYDFFQQQTDRYRQALVETQRQIGDLTRSDGVVSPPLQKELAVRKQADAEGQLRETQTAIREAEGRMKTLTTQAASVPPRRVSEVRTADNPELMQQLKGTLLNLELKRVELLGKYDPSYELVQEVDSEIAKARDAITAAEKEPLRDETTDRDPTYEWITAEQAKAASELSGLQAREAATSAMVEAYRQDAQRLEQKEIAQTDLLRQAKADEDNYLLYQRKMEEARISDALDRQRIANVVVAEPAEVPVRPTSNRLLVLLGGTLLGCLIGCGAALIANRADQSLRTPDEVRMYFDVPVVAALPKADR
jgi:uncharacterized protein involved in exopolysaccharide biosynthesis